MNWIIEHIDTAILFIIPAMLLAGLLFIWLSNIMYGGAVMLHEKEPETQNKTNKSA
jgi:hypothetical protein